MPFTFRELAISGIIVIEPRVFHDERGFFMETYKSEDFVGAGVTTQFVQDNHSRSKYGVLRGLHFQQEPFAQAKLVRCVTGKVFDVAVDVRSGSPTFGKYVSLILSEEKKNMVFIPRGFAHGFAALSEDVEVLYKVDNLFSPEHEKGLIWNDPQLNITWPIASPVLSEKDRQWPTLKEVCNTC